MRALIFVAGLLVSQWGYADQVENRQTLDAAEQSYMTGDFQSAIEKYRAVVDSGIKQGNVFYNLGLSYLRTGESGRGMAALLIARDLRPRDPDIAFNIEIALKKITDKVAATPPRSDWVQTLAIAFEWMTYREWFWLYTGLSIVMFGMSIFYLLRMVRFKMFWVWFLSGVVVQIILLLFGIMEQTRWKPAAIISSEVACYSGPTSAASQVLFKLHQGTPVWLAEGDGDWYKIYLSDNKTAWLEANHIESFVKPKRKREEPAT
jgi:hypothetical protein